MLRLYIHRVHFCNEYLKFTGYSPKLVSLDVIGQLSQCHVFLEKSLLLRNHDTRLSFVYYKTYQEL